MNLDTVWTIVRKDVREIRKNRMILYPLVIMPVIFAVVMPASTILGLPEASGEDLEILMIMITSGFIPLFVLIPAAISNVISAYSFVGEKVEGTLEPLLATPTTDSELLLGKMLAAFIPAFIVTLLAFLLFTAVVDILSYDYLGYLLLPNLVWAAAILVLSPLLAVASILVSIVFSARMNDPRAVQQMSMLVILPFIAIFFASVAQLIVLDLTVMLYLVVGLAVADRVLFSMARKLFEREAILTRWK